jgi:5-methylthioribose kinase
LFDFLLKFLLTNEVNLDKNNNENNITDYTYVPEICDLAENLKSCLD